MNRLHSTASMRINTLLTDKGSQFTDRFNGRISEVVNQTRFASPVQALKKSQLEKTELFKIRPS